MPATLSIEDVKFLYLLKKACLITFDVTPDAFFYKYHGVCHHKDLYRAAQCRWTFVYLARIFTPVSYPALIPFTDSPHATTIGWFKRMITLPPTDPLWLDVEKTVQLFKASLEAAANIEPHGPIPKPPCSADRLKGKDPFTVSLHNLLVELNRNAVTKGRSNSDSPNATAKT